MRPRRNRPPLARHGTTAARKFRQRYGDFANFNFDPAEDLSHGKHGVWQWNTDKPTMHDYVHSYFAGRQEDGVPETPSPCVTGPTSGCAKSSPGYCRG